ncbi:hypothetical protein MSG28_009458 [Choristoneura fumiferana]|uniref:Uncharacterized protein n=1 Tax=Choristoneura fumiferana TaxID=7141 RepID=A0ACC0JBB4_CHOFU|nr:hypothetical protein MSG28_009458 [Choristoneura fumiferana]
MLFVPMLAEMERTLGSAEAASALLCFQTLGGPGVDAHARHEVGEAVLHLQFLINEGALVTATADDQLHLWTFRQKVPQRVQSLKFQRERRRIRPFVNLKLDYYAPTMSDPLLSRSFLEH